jgi:hemoglobin-like flavoprotein
MMTNEEIYLVKESFKKVEPIADRAAELFYKRLFELDPGLRPLFTGDIQEQGKKLMKMIGMAVKGLDRIDELIPIVEGLGARHRNYGVQDSHYQTVAEALLWTLEKGLGDDFTEDTKKAWIRVYQLLATTMQNGSKIRNPETVGV